MIVPDKLQFGDEIRIIAPAKSLSVISPEVRDLAFERLNGMGFKVTFSKHVEEIDDFSSSSVESRINDIHEAFKDKRVKGVLAALGGYNSNQLLDRLDYALIRQNPKILCGYSDITALQNAIWAKTYLVTYSGPNFATFGCLKGIDYVINSFQQCLCTNSPIPLIAAEEWSEDKWHLDQNNRIFQKNTGYWLIQEGQSTGTILGGHFLTFSLLRGTDYFPLIDGAVLFLEGESDMNPALFDQQLQSLVQLPGIENLKGIVLGRFPTRTGITQSILSKIFETKDELSQIPVIANVDFGHTMPILTFPIGGKVDLSANSSRCSITIKH